MWLRTMMSGRDNVSIDVGRVLFAGTIATAIALEVFVVVVRGDHFDLVQFGGALASLLLAGGASLAVKGHTEPEEYHEPRA
jgi:hypothetical protein